MWRREDTFGKLPSLSCTVLQLRAVLYVYWCITSFSPPEYWLASLICCELAQAMGGQRSNASNLQGIMWKMEMLGPCDTHPGQVWINCTAYDYGARRVPAKHGENCSTGMTPNFPPPAPPPPPCAAYTNDTSCEGTQGQCWWDQETERCLDPPIQCSSEAGLINGVVCVHLRIQKGALGDFQFVNDSASFAYSLVASPPAIFRYDAWYSLLTGWTGTKKHPVFAQPWRFCVQYWSSTEGPEYQIAVCVSANPADFDLTRADTPNVQVLDGAWFTAPYFIGFLEFAPNSTTRGRRIQ